MEKKNFSQKAVLEQLIETFTKHKNANVEVTLQSAVAADLGVDSLEVMEIVVELEERFELELPDDALPEIRTVGDINKLVVKALQAEGRCEP